MNKRRKPQPRIVSTRSLAIVISDNIGLRCGCPGHPWCRVLYDFIDKEMIAVIECTRCEGAWLWGVQ